MVLVVALVTLASLPPESVWTEPRGRAQLDITHGIATITTVDLESLPGESVVDYINIRPTQTVDPVRLQRDRFRAEPAIDPRLIQAIDPFISVTSGSSHFAGQNMNSLSGIVNLLTKPGQSLPSFEYNLGAGTVFVPNKPDYQNMVLYSPLTVRMGYEGFLVAGIHPTWVQEAAKGATFCANMAKKEPDDTVRYYPFGCSDPVIVKMAQMSEAARQNGPWDQARLWMYTDKASLEEINKRLRPSLLPGYYVRNLRDIEKLGGWTDADRKNKKLFDPGLLFAPTGDTEASAFFFSRMASSFPKETRDALERGYADPVNQLWTEAGADLKTDHLRFMLDSLLKAENTDVQTGMLAFLDRRVPNRFRDTLKIMPEFDHVRTLAESPHKPVADLARRVIENYQAAR